MSTLKEFTFEINAQTTTYPSLHATAGHELLEPTQRHQPRDALEQRGPLLHHRAHTPVDRLLGVELAQARRVLDEVAHQLGQVQLLRVQLARAIHETGGTVQQHVGGQVASASAFAALALQPGEEEVGAPLLVGARQRWVIAI